MALDLERCAEIRGTMKLPLSSVQNLDTLLMVKHKLLLLHKV